MDPIIRTGFTPGTGLKAGYPCQRGANADTLYVTDGTQAPIGICSAQSGATASLCSAGDCKVSIDVLPTGGFSPSLPVFVDATDGSLTQSPAVEDWFLGQPVDYETIRVLPTFDRVTDSLAVSVATTTTVTFANQGYYCSLGAVEITAAGGGATVTIGYYEVAADGSTVATEPIFDLVTATLAGAGTQRYGPFVITGYPRLACVLTKTAGAGTVTATVTRDFRLEGLVE